MRRCLFQRFWIRGRKIVLKHGTKFSYREGLIGTREFHAKSKKIFQDGIVDRLQPLEEGGGSLRVGEDVDRHPGADGRNGSPRQIGEFTQPTAQAR